MTSSTALNEHGFIARLEARHLRPVNMQPADFAEFRLNNFDLIRLFAAVQVMIFHTFDRFAVEAPAWLLPLKAFPGVPIFFVVSGFLVSASYERSSSLASYARARALRIFPGLWACVAATAVVAVLFGHPLLTGSGAVWFITQLLGLIYTPAALDDFGMGSYNGSLWTIPVELQFYIVLPIAYLIARRLGDKLWVWGLFFAISLAAAVISAQIFPAPKGGQFTGIAKLINYTFINHVYLFFFGVILQRSGAYKSKLIAGKALIWLAALVALNAIMPGTPLTKLVLGVLAISVAYSMRGLATRLLGTTDISYGIYIYHGLVINVLIELGFGASTYNFWYVAPATVICALLSWFIIEKPAIRRKHKPRVVTDVW